MSEYYFSVTLEGNRTLYVAPLTDRRLAMAAQDIPDPSGYFLFESDGDGPTARVQILAQATSEEAAFRLRDMLNMV